MQYLLTNEFQDVGAEFNSKLIHWPCKLNYCDGKPLTHQHIKNESRSKAYPNRSQKNKKVLTV